MIGVSRGLVSRLRRVKLLLCDVDGVLTDGTVEVGAGGETKRFHIHDGMGLFALRKAGLRVGWISSRHSAATTERAGELKVDFLRQEKRDKVTIAEEILNETGFEWAEVCYVGDDLVDLGALARAGVGIAVANAVTEVKDQAHYVTKLRGGDGAIREVCELILKAQGLWGGIVESFSV